jgi:nucleoside-diphosphate-sugar epimerase
MTESAGPEDRTAGARAGDHNAAGREITVVVIGATGNVGTSVVQALGERSEVGTIRAVARRPTSLVLPKTTFVAADTTEDDLRGIVRGADVVIHLSWIFQPTHDPVVTWDNNVGGAIRVFEAASAEKVPAVVYSSSVAAYSPGPKDTPVDESWPTNGWPGAAYPREKAYLERWLDGFEHSNPDMRVVRMRPGFIFKREASTSQRRLFVGPFLPRQLVHGALIPVVPRTPGLSFQVLHSTDVAQAFVEAALRPVSGAFNLATDEKVDAAYLADVLGARPIPAPAALIRAGVWAAWHAHVIPASPGLFDTVLRLPLMDTARARDELDWSPTFTAREALEEFLDGVRTGAGMATEPLAPDGAARRFAELTQGVGERDR